MSTKTNPTKERTLQDIISELESSKPPDIARALAESLRIINERIYRLDGDRAESVTFAAILAKRPRAGSVIHVAPSLLEHVEDLISIDMMEVLDGPRRGEYVSSPIGHLRLSVMVEQGWRGRRWEIRAPER